MNNKELYKLTTPQKSIIMTEEYYKGTSVNNVIARIEFKECIDIEVLKESIEIVIKQNDSLRAKILKINGEYNQFFGEYNDDYIEEISTRELDNKEKKIAEVSKKHINIENNNLAKFYIFKNDDKTVDLVCVYHHVISDAWTASLCVSEITKVYNMISNKQIIEDDSYSYIDYIKDEDSYLKSDKFIDDKEYWLEQYRTERTTQFFDASNSPRGKRETFTIQKEYVASINEYCKKYNISTQCLFMAAFSLYLSKISNSKNISIGMPILNRKNNRFKNTMGMFIETLPFCIDINSDLNCTDYLKLIKVKQFSFLKHYRYPYEELQKDIKDNLNINQKLYSVAFSYQNAKLDNSSKIDYKATWDFNGYCADDLQMHISDVQGTGNLIVYYDYKINSISKDEIICIHKRLLHIVEQMISNPNLIIKDIEIVLQDEKNILTKVFNNTYSQYNKNTNIIEIIEKVASEFPNSTAVVDLNSKISYEELIKKVNITAYVLKEMNVQKGDVVSVLFSEKSINLIVSILASLKVGASFLMIYKNLPDERIKFILKDSKSKVIITDYSDSNKFSDIEVVDANLINTNKTYTPINVNVDMDDVAYLIYTSGTTGKPKGTEQTTGNLINFVYSFYNTLDKDISHNDNFLSLTNVSFDVCVAEFFTPLFFGAKLFLYKDIAQSTIEEIVKYIVKNKITFSYFPPSMLEDIAESMNKYKEKLILNKMLVGVEPIKTATLDKFLSIKQDIHIINGYGPSETTICSTMYDFNKEKNKYEIVPIGHPISNTQIYIMNEDKNILPINSNGEIFIAGDGVGKGYKNNKELTDEKYLIINNVKMFKTGDIGRWDKDGNIIFVGRNDNQVKFRGYRIDLGEIENSLKSNNEIRNAKVILDKDNYREEKLIAFVILNNSDVLEETLRDFLSKTLPYYMMPSKFIKVDAFPLTNNGKTDIQKLKSIALNLFKETIVLPSTNTEKTIYNIIKAKIGKELISINDNFLDLGIDSLDAISLIVDFEKVNLAFSLQDFYNYPSIRLLAEKFDKNLQKLDENKKYIKHINNTKITKTTIDGDILLLGSTGFLGSHILEKLLNYTKYNVYCLVRSNTKEKAQLRLKNILIDYFDEDFYNKYEERIIALNGDFTINNFGLSNSDFKKIKQNVSIIINSAACVKHYGSSDYFYNINYYSVKKALEFCERENKQFVQISTISVFEGYKSTELIDESTLYCDQDLENIYIKTKFEAEQLVANYINNGNNATIFRLGNIMWRKRDGKFQINEDENAFITKLKAIIKYNMVLDTMLDYKIDISPVDLCASAIVKLLLNNSSNIYHIENNNKITLRELVSILKELGYNIKVIDKDTYTKTILNDSKERNDLIALIETDIQNKNIDSTYSNRILKNRDFEWNLITKEYIKKFLV